MAGGPVACGAPATLSGTRTFPRSFISILSSSCMTGGVVALIHRWVWARQRFPQIRPPRPVHTAVSVPQSGEGGDAPARPSPDRARVCTGARSLLRARASPRRRRSDLGRGARSSEPDHGSRGVVEQIPGQHDLPLSEQVARGAFPGGDAHRKGMPHRRRCGAKVQLPSHLDGLSPVAQWLMNPRFRPRDLCVRILSICGSAAQGRDASYRDREQTPSSSG